MKKEGQLLGGLGWMIGQIVTRAINGKVPHPNSELRFLPSCGWSVSGAITVLFVLGFYLIQLHIAIGHWQTVRLWSKDLASLVEFPQDHVGDSSMVTLRVNRIIISSFSLHSSHNYSALGRLKHPNYYSPVCNSDARLKWLSDPASL